MTGPAGGAVEDDFRDAAVVGLGLIGGSVARDLLARGVRVRAFDPALVGARMAPAHPLAGVRVVPALEELAGAELVVLATPVSATPALLAALRPHLAAARLVVDVGSTKRSVVRAAGALGVGERFVGCHPLAGDHRSGWEASREGLFRGARVYLCATPGTARGAVARAAGLWRSLGAHPVEMDAAEHDRLLAWTSHLPQSAATALAVALAGAGIPPAALGPGGRDTTRLAGSSPELWTAVAADNADFLAEALNALEARLAELRACLAAGDVEATARFFGAGRAWFEQGPA